VDDALSVGSTGFVGEPDVPTRLGLYAESLPSRVALTISPTSRIPTPTSPKVRTSMPRCRTIVTRAVTPAFRAVVVRAADALTAFCGESSRP
jgi:hypothetical protein